MNDQDVKSLIETISAERKLGLHEPRKYEYQRVEGMPKAQGVTNPEALNVGADMLRLAGDTLLKMRR